MRRSLAIVLSFGLACTTASAAVTIDVDLARLRTAEGTEAFVHQIDAALPVAAQRKLRACSALLGFDPRRDLQRIVVDVASDGAAAARLIGLPAPRLAALIDCKTDPLAATANGLIGHPLPRRPDCAFVALGEDQALITSIANLATAATPAALPVNAAPITVTLVPGPHPRAAFMAAVERVVATSDGTGAWTIVATARDEVAASELAKRIAALQTMAGDGVATGLPALVDWGPLIQHASVAQDGVRLTIALAVPPELRHQLIERVALRLREHHG